MTLVGSSSQSNVEFKETVALLRNSGSFVRVTSKTNIEWLNMAD